MLVIILCSGVYFGMNIGRYQRKPAGQTELIMPDVETTQENFLSLLEPIAISFGNEDNRILTKNFLAPENGGRWSQGKVSAIKIYLANSSYDVSVQLTGVPFFGPKFREQEVDIYANGYYQDTWKFNKDTILPADISLVIPAKLIRNHQIELEFVTKNPKSPKELGVNEDTRLIGFALQDVVLQTAFNKEEINNTNLIPTKIQLELLVQSYKKHRPFEAVVNNQPISLKQEKGSNSKQIRYLIDLSGTEAVIKLLSTEECQYCQVTANILIPSKGKSEENIVKFTEIKHNDLTIAIPNHPLFISSKKTYWMITYNVSNKGETDTIVLKWGNLNPNKNINESRP